MPFVALTTVETATGEPITQALMRKIKDNFDDLDQRAGARTGDLVSGLDDAARVGWVLLDDGTIGNAASGATRADADTENLFTLIWNKFSATEAPMFDSAGSPVSRGVSAAADFAANRRIQLGTIAGRVLGAVGAGAGLTVRGIGDVVGQQTHAQSLAELRGHTHLLNNVGTSGGGATNIERNSSTTAAADESTTTAGSSSAANVMQPTVFVYWFCKL